jgi:5-methylcytosine-specific restriction protein A
MDFALRVRELPAPYGFELAINENFLNWEINLKLDDFSNGLVERFSEKFQSAPDIFLENIRLAGEKSKKFTFKVNDNSVLAGLPANNWHSVEFEFTRTFTDFDEALVVLDSTLVDIFAILLPLSGVVDLEVNTVDEYSHATENFREEGQRLTQVCTKYERSRFNRRLCLNHYGYRCVACSLLLAETYGEAGRDVIHVHHLTPVSEMAAPAILNPIKDLVPLCPNCHNVAHTRNPPYSPEELKVFISSKSIH